MKTVELACEKVIIVNFGENMTNLAKLALLGRPVRCLNGGRMMTTILTDYDESSDSYNGLSIMVGKSIDVSDPQPLSRTIRGLRRYPYQQRPDYAFQFVFPGEDETPLLNIAQGNVDQSKENIDTVSSGGNAPVEGGPDWNKVPPATEPFDETRDYNQDSVVDDRDRKAWKKQQKEKEQNR